MGIPKKIFIPKAQHAVVRLRQLFAQVLGYPVPRTTPDYGIDPTRLPTVSLSLPEKYLVFIPNASCESKCWPESLWAKLITDFTPSLPIVIPWGTTPEKARAVRLCADNPRVIVLPKLCLGALARIWRGAQGIVGVDTGLSHLAAALNVPAITLYGKTNPQRIGTLGPAQQHILFHPDSIHTMKNSLLQVKQALHALLQKTNHA